MIYRCDSVLSQTNIAYRELLQGIDRSKWDQPSNLDEYEVEKVKKFVNGKLLAKMQATSEDILGALKDTLPCLNELRRKTIVNVNFDKRIGNETVGCLIGRCFDKLARCNPRNNNEATGTSKVLHIIYPELFVMWDVAIRGGYGYGSNYEGKQYVSFLRRMQMLANYAIEQVKKECDVSRDKAITELKCEGHTLAKTLDEYNYVKFTLNDDAVWKAEYKSCNSPQLAR